MALVVFTDIIAKVIVFITVHFMTLLQSHEMIVNLSHLSIVAFASFAPLKRERQPMTALGSYAELFHGK